MKKIFAMTLVLLCIITSQLSAFAETTGTETVKDEVSPQVEALLKLLDINVPQGESVSKGDFASILVKMKGMQSISATSEPIADVSQNDENYGAIMFCVSMKWLTVDNNKFYPQTDISLREAIKGMLRIMDCPTEIVNDDKYDALAKQKGLYKNIGILSSRTISSKEMKQLIFNTLNADMIEIVYNAAGQYSLKNDQQSFLESVHGISEKRGIVTGVGYCVISGDSELGKYNLQIDYENYTCNFLPSYDLFGKKIGYYVQKEDTDEYVVSIYSSTAEKEIVISADDCCIAKGFNENDSYADKQSPSFTYWYKNKAKTLKFDANVCFYYNGLRTNNIVNDTFLPDSGYVKYIENNNIRAVMIWDFEHFVVSEVADYSCKILSKDGTVLTFDENEIGESIFIVKDGRDVDFSTIHKNDVLAIAAQKTSDGNINTNKLVMISIYSDKISGKCTAVEDDCIEIDGKEYKALSGLDFSDLLNKSTQFYLGYDNKVVYWSDINLKSKYYYLCSKGKMEDGIEDIYVVKVFNEDGEFERFTCNEKILFTGSIDGMFYNRKKVKTENIIMNLSPQLITMELDENNCIKALSVATDNSERNDYLGFDTSQFTMEINEDNFRIWSNLLGENYFFGSSTKVFLIPDSMDEDEFKVGTRDILVNDKKYKNVKLYDATENMNISAVVISTDGAGDFSDAFYKSSCAVVYGTFKYYDDKENSVLSGVRAYQDGRKIKLIEYREDLKDPKVSNWSSNTKTYFSELGVGDVIQYSLNADNRVETLHIVHVYDGNKLDDISQCYSDNGYGYISPLTTSYGTVTMLERNILTLSSSTTRKHYIGDANVYIMDIGRNKLEQADIADICTETNNSEGDYVFIGSQRTKAREIVIYRR